MERRFFLPIPISILFPWKEEKMMLVSLKGSMIQHPLRNQSIAPLSRLKNGKMVHRSSCSGGRVPVRDPLDGFQRVNKGLLFFFFFLDSSDWQWILRHSPPPRQGLFWDEFAHAGRLQVRAPGSGLQQSSSRGMFWDSRGWGMGWAVKECAAHLAGAASWKETKHPVFYNRRL
ncbi:hypothetical protein CDAR_258241 [Caerostris darwini]|uniref:Uncharacterized protein n=1 Tax=Caerostris darwini TaxID=1538125 RepID=A0AAV4WYL7_9ARAC|nr:hypothetical protein CDAR_258241 [Caerostris darwini]